MKKLFSILLAICLIAGLLPVVASAASATISFGHESGPTTANVAEGDVAYFITEDGKVHNNGSVANAGNYNVKVDNTGSEPTIYLKGATITAPKDTIVMKTGAYTIVVEEESTVSSTNGNCITAQNAHLTITGSAKLNIDVKYGVGINMYETTLDGNDPNPLYDLTLDDANINLTADGTQGSFCLGIGNHARSINVDGGTFVAKSDKATVMYLYTGEMNITNGAQVDIEVNDQSAFGRSKKVAFTMDSGHLKLRTSSAAFSFTQDSTIAFTGGTVDFSGAAFIYGPKIDVSEYLDEHTIVVCQSKDGKGAEPYDAEKHNLSYMNYFQLTKGSSYEVTVMKGTTDLSVASKGDTVTITARIAPDGNVFDKWEVNNGDVKLADPTATTTTFTMPGENVKITATYKRVESNEESTPEESTEETTPEESTPEESLPHVSLPQESTPEESTPEASTPDTNKNDGNKKPATGKKTNVTNVLLVVIIVILVLGIGAGAAFIVIRVKKLNAGDEEPAEDAEAPAEDAEAPAEDAAEDAE